MKKIKVAVVDDHKIFLDGISSLLATIDGIELVFVAEDGEKALKKLQVNSNIDVLISDLTMDKMGGKELCLRMRLNYPDINVLILSMHDDIDLVYELFQSGALGYVLKNTGKKELIAAIASVADGIPFYNDTFKSEIFNKVAFAPRKQKPKNTLTNREIEIIQLIASEHTTQEIANKLFISLHTVESHRKNILRKTNVRNLAGLIKYAIKAKIIE